MASQAASTKEVNCEVGGEAEQLILAGVEMNPGVDLLVLIEKINMFNILTIKVSCLKQ